MNLGTMDQADGRVTFRYERRFARSIDTVWQAITDPSQMEAWMGIRVEIEPREDGAFVTYHGNGMRVVDTILRFRPPTLLEHTFWVEVNPDAMVLWRLYPGGDGTVLTLTHMLSVEDIQRAVGTTPAPDDDILLLSRNAAGWHHLLDSLEAWLDGRTLAWSPEQQEALRTRYAALL